MTTTNPELVEQWRSFARLHRERFERWSETTVAEEAVVGAGRETGELLMDRETGLCKLADAHYTSRTRIDRRIAADEAQRHLGRGIVVTDLAEILGRTREGTHAIMNKAVANGYVRRIGGKPARYVAATIDLVDPADVDPAWALPLAGSRWPRGLVAHLAECGLTTFGDVARIEPLDFRNGPLGPVRTTASIPHRLAKAGVRSAIHLPQEVSMACLAGSGTDTPEAKVTSTRRHRPGLAAAEISARSVLAVLVEGPKRIAEIGRLLGDHAPYMRTRNGAALLDQLGLVEYRAPTKPHNAPRTFKASAAGLDLAASREFAHNNSIADALAARSGSSKATRIPYRDRGRRSPEALEPRIEAAARLLLDAPASAMTIERGLGRAHDAAFSLGHRTLRHLVARGYAERMLGADGKPLREHGILHRLTNAGRIWLGHQPLPTEEVGNSPSKPVYSVRKGWWFPAVMTKAGARAELAHPPSTFMRCRETGAFQDPKDHFASPTAVKRRLRSDRLQRHLSGWHTVSDLSAAMGLSFERARRLVDKALASGEVLKTHDVPARVAAASLHYARDNPIPTAWTIPTDALGLPARIANEFTACGLNHAGDIARLSVLDVLNHLDWGRAEVAIVAEALAAIGLEMDSPIPSQISMQCLAVNGQRPLPDAVDRGDYTSFGAPLVEWLTREEFLRAAGTSVHGAVEWLSDAMRNGVVIRTGFHPCVFALAEGRREPFRGQNLFRERLPAMTALYPLLAEEERAMAIYELIGDDMLTRKQIGRMLGLPQPLPQSMLHRVINLMLIRGALVATIVDRSPDEHMGARPRAYSRGPREALALVAPKLMGTPRATP